MKAKPKPRPLTDEQRRRAESDPAWRIPYVLAKQHCKGDDNLYDMMLESAVDAYVRVARCFDPSRHQLGEQGWQPYAWHWTKKQMLTGVRKRFLKERPELRRPLDSPELRDDIPGLIDRCPQPLETIARDEEHALVLGAIDGKYREAMACLLMGMTPVETAKCMGLERRAAYWLQLMGVRDASLALAFSKKQKSRKRACP